MKTLNFIKQIATTFGLAMLVFIAFSSFSDGDKKVTKKAKTANSSETELRGNPLNSMNSISTEDFAWLFEENEEELKVMDLDANYKKIPLWNKEAVETKLEVKDYTATEEFVPFWMLVEQEPELEVGNLHTIESN
jgi:hypothetical protein